MKKKNKKKIKQLEKNLDKAMEELHLLWLGDWSSISGAKHYGDFAEGEHRLIYLDSKEVDNSLNKALNPFLKED